MIPNGEFGQMLRRVWTALRWASLGMIVLAVLVVGREVREWFRVAWDINPALGVLFLGVVAAGLWLAVVRPMIRYWAVPAAVRPPDDQGSIQTAAITDLAERGRFLVRLADNLARNPRMATAVPAVMQARHAADRFVADCKPGGPIEQLRAQLQSLESTSFEPLYKTLDDEANQIIRAEALAVGLGTAISMNGTVDAWIVLWRNLNLVTKLAGVYYGRPGVRGTLFVLRDVATAMFLATKLQGALEGATGLLGGWLGKATSTMMGPVADGIVNALVTTRIGYVAKARCRSFHAWTEASVQGVLVTCFKEAASHGRGIVGDIAGSVKSGVVKVSGEMWRKTTEWISGLFPKGEPLVVE